MTYREIAAARRVKLAAAVRLVQRHKWRKQTGNDGTARILVPPDWAKRSDRVPPDIVHDVVHDATDDVVDDVAPDSHILAGALAALEAALVDANKRADAAQVLAERTLAELAEAHTERAAAFARAERAEVLIRDLEADLRAKDLDIADQRVIAEQAKAKAEAAQIAQAEAEADAEQLRQADATRKARGRLRRAWAAWRGE
jgi:hypothetical protein